MFVLAFIGAVGFGAVAAVTGSALLERAILALPFHDLPEDIELAALEERSVVVAADGSQLAVLAEEFDRRRVPLDVVPAHVRQAVIAAEDQSFYAHDGYDAGGIGRRCS